MKAINRKKLMIVLIAAAVALMMLSGAATYAYLTDAANPVVNGFSENVVTASIDETGINAQGIKYYEIIPGISDGMDPSVTVYNTVDAYVFVKVTDNVSNGTTHLISYEMAPGWTFLSESGNERVYYRESAGLGSGWFENGKLYTDSTLSEEKSAVYTIMYPESVSYDASLVNEDMLDSGGDLLTGLALSFKGGAIQKEGFATPAEAYAEMTGT